MQNLHHRIMICSDYATLTERVLTKDRVGVRQPTKVKTHLVQVQLNLVELGDSLPKNKVNTLS